MRIHAGLWLCALLALTVSACARHFEADVTRFHALGAPGGQSVLFEPLDPAKEDTLEFMRYADFVGERLRDYGYVPAGDSVPDIIARLDYSVTPLNRFDDGPQSTVGVGVGGGGSRVGGGVGVSFPLGEGPKQTHRRRLVLILVEPGGDRNLYEARVESDGPSADLTLLIPMMLDALFEDFPGASGETSRYRAPVPEPRLIY